MSSQRMQGARIGSILNDANFSHADLTESTFTRGQAYRADFSHAVLSRANLSGSGFEGANFTGADLSFADLSRTRFLVASLDGATLYNANLMESDLEAIMATGVDGRHADLRGATGFPIPPAFPAGSSAVLPNGHIVGFQIADGDVFIIRDFIESP